MRYEQGVVLLIKAHVDNLLILVYIMNLQTLLLTSRLLKRNFDV
jgi:hypothetical protein